MGCLGWCEWQEGTCEKGEGPWSEKRQERHESSLETIVNWLTQGWWKAGCPTLA